MEKKNTYQKIYIKTKPKFENNKLVKKYFLI